ncbi:hypothetical protein LTS08_000397 [Lithohypha guttulata]|nr:hypothetical protein LTS08_000397 [Lithohypha guttulata]
MAHHEPQRASLLVPIFLCFLLLVLPVFPLQLQALPRDSALVQDNDQFGRRFLYSQNQDQFGIYAPTDDKFSYYQIAGIHGYPQVAWDDVYGNPNGSTGYCMHNSVLFELWHRPYLALFEQTLSEHARAIASAYPADVRPKYISAAESLRIPYWDWGQTFRLPDAVTKLSLVVNSPEGLRSISNPLRRYDFQIDVEEIVTYDYGFLNKLNHTARHYDPIVGSQEEAASARLLVSSAGRLSNLYQLITSTTNWTEFAPHLIGNEQNPKTNLERLHGGVHNDVGGIGGSTVALGHMTVIPLSAFDPIFWLHHANVDRITAIWQVLHPDDYVQPVLDHDGTYYQEPAQLDHLQTSLAPFHSDDSTEMWTAATVRDTAIFGYTYPELIDWNVSASDLVTSVRQKVNELYNPDIQPTKNRTTLRNYPRNANLAKAMSNVHGDIALQLGVNNLNVQWYLRLVVVGLAVEQGVSVYLFVAKAPTDCSLWSSANTLVGAFSPSGSRRPTTMHQVDIPCTHIIAAAVDRGVLPGIRSDAVVPFLSRNLVVKTMRADGTEFSAVPSSGVKLWIVSRPVQPRKSLSEFPLYGDFKLEMQLI